MPPNGKLNRKSLTKKKLIVDNNGDNDDNDDGKFYNKDGQLLEVAPLPYVEEQDPLKEKILFMDDEVISDVKKRIFNLHLAASKGDIEEMKIAIDSFESENIHMGRAWCYVKNVPMGDTILHHIARRGEVEIMKYIIDRVKFIDAIDCIQIRNKMDIDALTIAVDQGNVSMVELLIDNHANIFYQNPDNHMTILHIAAKMGRCEIITLLLTLGLDWKIKNRRNETAFDVSLNEKTKASFFTLHALSYSSEKYDEIKKILALSQRRANIDLQILLHLKNEKNMTCMEIAALSNNVQILALYLKLGANVNREYQLFLNKRNKLAMQCIIKAGFTDGWVFLNKALQADQLDDSKIILQSGVDGHFDNNDKEQHFLFLGQDGIPMDTMRTMKLTMEHVCPGIKVKIATPGLLKNAMSMEKEDMVLNEKMLQRRVSFTDTKGNISECLAMPEEEEVLEIEETEDPITDPDNFTKIVLFLTSDLFLDEGLLGYLRLICTEYHDRLMVTHETNTRFGGMETFENFSLNCPQDLSPYIFNEKIISMPWRRQSTQRFFFTQMLLKSVGLHVLQPMEKSFKKRTVYLSHSSKNAVNAVIGLKLVVENYSRDTLLHIGRDILEISHEDEMKEDVKSSNAVILYLTVDVFQSPIVRLEIEAAVDNKKRIILVQEMNKELGGGDYDDILSGASKKIQEYLKLKRNKKFIEYTRDDANLSNLAKFIVKEADRKRLYYDEDDVSDDDEENDMDNHSDQFDTDQLSVDSLSSHIGTLSSPRLTWPGGLRDIQDRKRLLIQELEQAKAIVKQYEVELSILDDKERQFME